MVDKYMSLRNFLIGCGFVQEPEIVRMKTGSFYRYFDPEYELIFYVNIESKCAEARYPDKQYNSANPYSTKQCVTSLNWEIEDSVESIIENITMFFDKIYGIIKG